jgi:hypothetical protein
MSEAPNSTIGSSADSFYGSPLAITPTSVFEFSGFAG